MNKSELIEKVAGEAGLAKSEAEKAVNAFRPASSAGSGSLRVLWHNGRAHK